jgi:hypothetical protein
MSGVDLDLERNRNTGDSRHAEAPWAQKGSRAKKT